MFELTKFLRSFPYGVGRAIRNLCLLTILLVGSMVPARAEIVIAALGDSLTQGYGLEEADGFVPQLQNWLAENGAADVRMVNAGVSGDTTAGGFARIGWTLDGSVDAVIVILGGNDLLRGIEPANSRENLDGILAEIDKQGLDALLVGMPAPANYGPEYQAEFSAIYPDLATQYDVLLFPNFLQGLGDTSNPATLAPLMQSDFLHPNEKGVALIVDALGPAVLELVALVRASQS